MIQEQHKFSIIGNSVHRVDGVDKVTGKAKYVADLIIPGIQLDGQQFDELRTRTRLSGGVLTARNQEKKQSQSERNGDQGASHQAFHERIKICRDNGTG